MPLQLSVEVKGTDGVKRVMNRMLKGTEDPRQILTAVGDVVLKRIQRGFAGQFDPATGQPWRKPSPLTLAIRGQGTSTTLRASGSLYRAATKKPTVTRKSVFSAPANSPSGRHAQPKP